VNEHILAAIIADDEAEAFLRIEEFDDALAFANDLRGHSAATATAAAEATATAAAAAKTAATAAVTAAAAAAAITAAAAEAAAVTIAAASAAAVAAALLKSTAEFAECWLFAETFALVSTATTAVAFAPSIETHEPSELSLPANP
jgi:hypothetical protein